jgi:DNA-binding MarR family transcriptional regulator
MKDKDLQLSDMTYFQFLKIIQSAQSVHTSSGLTPNEIQLLQEVVLSHFEGQAFTVKQALQLQDLGSPATLHKRIQNLRKGGFLCIEKKDTDHRSKYLIATPLAIQYFECLGLAMQKAIDAEAPRAGILKT